MTVDPVQMERWQLEHECERLRDRLAKLEADLRILENLREQWRVDVTAAAQRLADKINKHAATIIHLEAELEAENENLTALYEGAKVAAREWRVERDEYRSRMLASEHLAGSLVTERDEARARLAELEADKRQVERERDRWERIAEDAVAEVKRLRLELDEVAEEDDMRVIRLQKENERLREEAHAWRAKHGEALQRENRLRAKALRGTTE